MLPSLFLERSDKFNMQYSGNGGHVVTQVSKISEGVWVKLLSELNQVATKIKSYSSQ